MGHHLAMSHPNLEEMMASHGHGGNNLPLPTYEESMLQAQKMQQAQSMASGLQQQQQFEFMQQHPRQQSIPASMTYSHQLSPLQHGLMSPPNLSTPSTPFHHLAPLLPIPILRLPRSQGVFCPLRRPTWRLCEITSVPVF